MSANPCDESQILTFLSENVVEHKKSVMESSIQNTLLPFINQQRGSRRPLVVLTSGGTSVPLEKNAVRFITNFSAGRRGAWMAERFLSNGYAVIFLCKSDSARPFTPIGKSVDELMEMLAEEGVSISSGGSGDEEGKSPASELRVANSALINCLAGRRSYKDFLCTVTFDSVVEYVYMLKRICETTRDTFSTTTDLNQLTADGTDICRRPLVVLPAAVSDYYLPLKAMAEHKISGGTGLDLHLECVPKGLGALRHIWLRGTDALIVSFKLETDQNVLLKKAHYNLDEYDLEVVVANLLHNYKQEVQLVFKGSKASTEVIRAPSDAAGSIEIPLTDRLCELHQQSTRSMQSPTQ